MARQWILRPVSGTQAPELRIAPGDHVLGSSRDADLQVPAPTVSRRHARVVSTGETVTIEDLGSTNGTAVDGALIDAPTEVRRKARVAFGQARFSLEPVDAQKVASIDSEVSVLSQEASVLLGPATVGFLRAASEEVTFGPGEVIVRRGERHEVFFVIVSGEVELLLGEAGARQRPLARMGAGGIFGAESVLAKEGAAADAVAVTEVRLLRYPAHALPTALQESASLRRKLLGGIARHLHEATSDALDLMKGQDVIARLVQGDSDPDELLAASARMRSIQKRIPALAASDDPLLLVGEDGTGRTLVARLVHDASARSEGPLIAVNCRELTPGHAAELILGDDLGGATGPAVHGSGGVHFAHEGTLVLRSADALEPAVQKILASFLARQRSSAGRPFPNTRVVVTARLVADDEHPQGLVPALAACFPERVDVPPLVERPKDILPLAEEFLRRQGLESPRITEGARHALLSLRYQRRNVAELRDVVELAARVADGPEIRSEHIFGGVGEDVIPGVDVTSTGMLRRLLGGRSLWTVRLAVLAGFLGVIVLCLGFGMSLSGRVANAAIWSLWEPAVFALFLLAGPIWCTVCPLSSAARLAKKVGSRDRPPPAWMVRHGPWLAIVGFALIIWVERVFHSLDNPLTSALLLGTLLLAAVTGALLYRREVWCRHLCPLGRFGSALAPAAPLQLAAKRQVCASSCTTHACFKGTAELSGCTVFHHPLEAKQFFRCKLCLDCLRACPHGSARLQIRPPVAALWNLDSGAVDVAMFAMAVSLLALGLVVVERVPMLQSPLPFTLLVATTVAAGIGLHLLLLRLAGDERRRIAVVQVSMVLLLLGWAALMTSQLANVPVLAEAKIVLLPSPWLPPWAPTEISLLGLLQVGFVLGASLLAAVAFDQVRSRQTDGGRVGWVVASGLLVAYAVVVVALVVV